MAARQTAQPVYDLPISARYSTELSLAQALGPIVEIPFENVLRL